MPLKSDERGDFVYTISIQEYYDLYRTKLIKFWKLAGISFGSIFIIIIMSENYYILSIIKTPKEETTAEEMVECNTF